MLARWLRIGDGALVVCALVLALFVIVPQFNTTRHSRTIAFVCGVAFVTVVTVVTIQVAQNVVTPTCIPL